MATAKKKTEAVAEVKTPKTEKKETVKAAEPKKEAVKAPETKKAPAKKETVKKTAEKKPAAKKAVAPKPAGMMVVLEFQGRQVNMGDIFAAVMAKAGKAKTVEVYVKPEDGAAYYVADGETGKVEF
ncbi:MAG: hypothetical protein J6C43_03825 [Oscillospiraceae bacterium]|nr:hypothetical protein [Oscillospiraceae bacterium]